ncbi:MAG: prepilin peptidase [Clostridium sp.]
MELVIYLLIFFFGSIIGSFLNVCIYRIPEEKSISFPPSSCGSCNSMLNPKDLIPIFSYLFLKGKCRYCCEKVSKQYPIIEAVTGLLFVFIFIKFGFTLDSIKFMLLTALLIVIGIIDLKTEYIYTSTIIFGIISGIIFIGIEYFNGFSISPVNYLLGALSASLILALIVFFTGAMGWGDVELIFLIGLFLGIKLNLFNVFLSIVIGGLVAVVLMATKIKSRKDSMAFGPYIAMSTYIVILFGNDILNWYITSFFY